MKEKRELIEQDIKYDNYYIEDINFLIEFSYIIGKCVDMSDFSDILDCCTDGIEIYSLFVKFCYDQYDTGDDYVNYLKYNISELITKFKEKYFKEE